LKNEKLFTQQMTSGRAGIRPLLARNILDVLIGKC